MPFSSLCSLVNEGLFAEMGPYDLSSDLKPILRKTSWNKQYSMLFIDNPVGAGFSFTKSDAGYCRNTKGDVADNLYELLLQFYQIFPQEKDNPLYITGESYAGHYVPAISFRIHEMNQRVHEGGDGMQINLAGAAIGDGWVDPVNMIPGYPELMYNLGERTACLQVKSGCLRGCLMTAAFVSGLADGRQRAVIQDYCDRAVAAIRNGEMESAFRLWDEMLNGDLYPYPNYFHNITGSSTRALPSHC